MARKMLLAGVGNYQGYANDLVAAPQEIDRWARLLSAPPYGLTSVVLPASAQRPSPMPTPLKDTTATRQNILDGLDELLRDAKQDDQLLCMLIGHGSIYYSYKPGEQAFIAYPNGDGDLRNAAITFRDILDRFEKHKPPLGTDITFVFATCFAARFAPDGKGTVMFIDPADLVSERDAVKRFAREEPVVGEIRRFAELASLNILLPTYEPMAEPVIVTASGRDEPAYQVEVTADHFRLLFCQRAIARLGRYHDTFNDLIRNVNPLQYGYSQHAAVHGSKERLVEQFPGERSHPLTLDATVSGGTAEYLVASDAEESSEVTAGSSIQMRILGMGCFIKPRQGIDEFAARIVFPNDTEGKCEAKHFSFVEINEEDIVHVYGTGTAIRKYRAGNYFKRWLLTEHLVQLSNPIPGAFSRSELFQVHVPDMPTLCPELTDPDPICYDDFPPPPKEPPVTSPASRPRAQERLISGFVDIAGGSVEIGALETGLTKFALKIGPIPTWEGKTPLSVVLNLPFKEQDQYAAIIIRNESGSDLSVILVKNGAVLLAGNARERDITGDGEGDTPNTEFLIFYNLAPPPLPLNPALPTVESTPVNACSVIRWP